MGKYDELTKYISLIKPNELGEWILDTKNDGTPEHPIQLPFVVYSSVKMLSPRCLFSI